MNKVYLVIGEFVGVAPFVVAEYPTLELANELIANLNLTFATVQEATSGVSKVYMVKAGSSTETDDKTIGIFSTMDKARVAAQGYITYHYAETKPNYWKDRDNFVMIKEWIVE